MKISEQGLALIRRFEGFCPTLYICPAGKPTIGYGHVVAEPEEFPHGVTQEAADILLSEDVAMSEQAIRRFVTAELTQNQFDALASFIYNVGARAFEKSTLLRLLNTNAHEAAADQLSRWVYAGGKKQPGLIARRQAERALFLA